MHIEINAGGLSGGIAVAKYQSNMSSFISSSESVISSFKAVKKSTGSLPGGVGTLKEAVSAIDGRIKTEEKKKQSAITIQKKSNDFLNLAVQVDKQVATLVNKNRDAFYKVNPWARPAAYWDKEKRWYENVWNWLCVGEREFEKGAKKAWDAVKDTLKKAWDGLVKFYNEHKKIIDTILVVVGAIAAIAAVVASGGGALIFLLEALGCSAGLAAAISGAVAVVAVTTTVAATTMNVIDIWAEIDNPTFQAWKKGLNIASGVSNFIYSIGGLYNSFHHISPAQAKGAMKSIMNNERGAFVDGQYVSFLSDYQPGADSTIHRELLNDKSVNHFYSYDNPNGGKIIVSADPCNKAGVANLVNNPNEEYIVLSGTHGGKLGNLQFEKEFFNQDVASFKGLSNVKVINIADHIVSLDSHGMVTGYNMPYLKGLVNSGKNVICAWCYSERSMLVKNLLGLL